MKRIEIEEKKSHKKNVNVNQKIMNVDNFN